LAAARSGVRVASALNCRPLHIVCSNAGSVGTTFIPIGVEASKGVITATWERNPADPSQADHPAAKEFKALAAKYMPNLDFNNTAALPGYNSAYMIGQVLQCCGDNLTREDLLRQATTLKDIVPPMFIEGIGIYRRSLASQKRARSEKRGPRLIQSCVKDTAEGLQSSDDEDKPAGWAFAIDSKHFRKCARSFLRNGASMTFCNSAVAGMTAKSAASPLAAI
jgi:hypothetical protein